MSRQIVYVHQNNSKRYRFISLIVSLIVSLPLLLLSFLVHPDLGGLAGMVRLGHPHQVRGLIVERIRVVMVNDLVCGVQIAVKAVIGVRADQGGSTPTLLCAPVSWP